MKSEKTYRIVEIFDSIEGEGKRAGQLVTFIRFAGCNLHCSYCDTAYALSPSAGLEMSIPAIISSINYKRVTLTGGEPLLHDLRPLFDALHQAGIEVNVETNGSQDITGYFDYDNVFFTVDFKTYTSGMSDRMRTVNFLNLRSRDVLKFVVGSLEDLHQAANVYQKYAIKAYTDNVYLSPVFGKISPAEIVEYMKRDAVKNVDWRIQLQLHKFIWDPEKRGV